MQNYKKLLVWEKAHKFVIAIYNLVESFPNYETFGLCSQMRRSAYSISTNIAEGAGRNSNPEFLNFLNIAFGSANELEYQILLAKDLNYIDTNIYKKLNTEIGEIRAMLLSLVSSIKNS